MDNKTISAKHGLGAYYTPPHVSEIMANWAIRSREDHILEPSFGGCGFLDACKTRLQELGVKYPVKQLYGCDIDPDAFNYLAKFMGPVNVGYTGRFLLRDFLSINDNSFIKDKFDVVIGNPPYIANNRITPKQKELCNLINMEWSNVCKGRVNIWVYIILNSLSMLNRGGRLSCILPNSSLKADYAKSVFDLISNRFNRTLIISLHERIFRSEGAREQCIILFAEGWNQNQNNINTTVRDCISTDDILTVLDSWQSKKLHPVNDSDVDNPGSVSIHSKNYLNRIQSLPCICKLGSIFDIKIGFVTGDKEFFVLNKSKAELINLDIDKFGIPIVSKSNVLMGATYTRKDYRGNLSDNTNCILLNSTLTNLKSSIIRKYLNTYPISKREKNKTFSSRKYWHQPDDGNIPDVFLPYMGQHGPRFILNTAKINCTNNIHRLYIKNKSYNLVQIKLAIISLYSTCSQLSAELVCRHYGSGVLKIEPSNAKDLLLVYPDDLDEHDTNRAFTKIDHMLRNNDYNNARLLADELIFSSEHLKGHKSLLPSLNDELDNMRRSRMVR